MEPFTTAAIAIGSVVATKALEKTGEKVGETLWQQTGNFLNSLRNESPDTVTAIEKAPERPLDYGKAVLETEAAAKANPEVAQRMQELVATAETEPLPNLEAILNQIANALKSQPSEQKIYIKTIEKLVNFANRDIHIEQQNITI
jgi:DNA segregation ATPase FtsK/SpoIIIE-like protein